MSRRREPKDFPLTCGMVPHYLQRKHGFPHFWYDLLLLPMVSHRSVCIPMALYGVDVVSSFYGLPGFAMGSCEFL